MELNWTSIDYGPSTTVPVLATILYTTWFVLFARRARRTAALMPLTIPPLLLGAFAAWVGLANTARAASIFPGSRVAVAAGFADALSVVRFGLAITALCALIAIVGSLSQDDVIGAYPRPPIVIAVLCALPGSAALITPAVFRGSFAFWNATLIAAFLSLALLIPLAVVAMLGHRRTVSRRNQLLALGITLAIALLHTAVAWWLVDHYRKIALGLG